MCACTVELFVLVTAFAYSDLTHSRDRVYATWKAYIAENGHSVYVCSM